MTQKEIIKMASDSFIMFWMCEIAKAKRNMICKTESDQKSDIQRIKKMTKYIMERFEEIKQEG